MKGNEIKFGKHCVGKKSDKSMVVESNYIYCNPTKKNVFSLFFKKKEAKE
jgi:hypothetical protein